MSRGLGKWEKYIIDALTFYDPDINYGNGDFWGSYSINDLACLYIQAGTGKTSPEQLGIFHTNSYDKMTDKEKSTYQGIARASRSLEKKGIVTKRIVKDGFNPKTDNEDIWIKHIDIINLFDKKHKRLIGKYHYLSKRLTEMRKIKTANRLLINRGDND